MQISTTFIKIITPFKSQVRGKVVDVNPNLIAKILEVPSPLIPQNIVAYPYKKEEQAPEIGKVIDEICDIPIVWMDRDTKIGQKNLCLSYRLLNHIVSCNIDRRAHTTDFGSDRAQLLYAIGTGVCIDLTLYIFNLIYNASKVMDKR